MTTELMSDHVVIWGAHCPQCGRFCKVTKTVYAFKVFSWGKETIREMDGFSHAEGTCKRCGNVKPNVQFCWQGDLD